MSTFVPIDAAQRERIRTDLDANLCVEAGAGTGKTTVLVARIVEILRRGHATVDEIAVITFTEAAAAELAARVRQELEDALARRPKRASATASTRRSGLHRAHVETIHAFASGLLRERPVEAGLDPGFEVLDDLAAQVALRRLPTTSGCTRCPLRGAPRGRARRAARLRPGADPPARRERAPLPLVAAARTPTHAPSAERCIASSTSSRARQRNSASCSLTPRSDEDGLAGHGARSSSSPTRIDRAARRPGASSSRTILFARRG